MGRYVKYLPMTIVSIAGLAGIIYGLLATTVSSQDSLWGMINQLYMINELTENTHIWLTIASHNLYMAFLCGVLGLVSGGLFIMYPGCWTQNLEFKIN